MTDNVWDRYPTRNNNVPGSQQGWDRYPTLGGSTPSVAQTEENRARNRSAQAAGERFNALPWFTRGDIGARNLVSAIPGVRSVPPISRYANPQGGTQEATNLEDYRLGYGPHAAIGRTIGHSLPYVAIGSGLPALMSTLPRAAAVGAGIEAGSAAAEGEDTIPAAISGAASAVPGALLSRAITPRSPQGVADINANAQRSVLNALLPANRRPVSAPTPTLFETRYPLLQNQLLANLAGYQLGAHPALSIAAGAAPTLYRAGANALTNAETRGAIARATGQRANPLDRLIYNYSTNQVVSPEIQALIQALAIPSAQEGANYLPTPTSDTLTGQ